MSHCISIPKDIEKVDESIDHWGPSPSLHIPQAPQHAPTENSASDQTGPQHDYKVTFQVDYHPDEYQSLFVVGSISHLGSWKEYLCEMTRVLGDSWALEIAIPSYNSVFEYKYVVMNHGQPERWEQCSNRKADLKLNSGDSNKVWFEDQFDVNLLDTQSE